MKPIQSHQSGSALVITLTTTSLLGVVLASYLGLVRSQNVSTMRSQQWNLAIPVAEAGIEEALTQLNWDSTNLSAYGWTLSYGTYTKERVLDTSKYVVRISNSSPPVIISQAYVLAPLSSAYMDPPRTIMVTVTNDALFAKGMVAKGPIDLSGNNIRTDSFDSGDPAFSSGGRYDPAKARDNGDVATNSGLINSFNVGNADIYGKAATGPGGSITVGSSGGVGSKAWHAGGNNGIEPGWSSDDMNVSFPDVKEPFSGGAYTPSSGNVDGEHYAYILDSGNYQLSSLSFSGQEKVLVRGNAVLYVTGNVAMSGQSSIIINNGASLKLYVAGASASLGGNGIANPGGRAMNFAYYGLPSNTSVSLSGNAAFSGTIYAPQAAFTLGGGGSDSYDFVGASITGSVRMNGHYRFHYDEYLGRVGPRRGYTINSWNEI